MREFEVFTAMKNQVMIYSAVTPCSDVIGSSCFGQLCESRLWWSAEKNTLCNRFDVLLKGDAVTRRD